MLVCEEGQWKAYTGNNNRGAAYCYTPTEAQKRTGTIVLTVFASILTCIVCVIGFFACGGKEYFDSEGGEREPLL